MKVAGGLCENGTVIGNTYDKYGSSNPVVRWMMKGFAWALSDLVAAASPSSIHEVGCGEGYWVLRWLAEGFAARGTDVSHTVIEMARANAAERGVSPELFAPRSIYDLAPPDDAADLVVCCEVLEHLHDPLAGLRALEAVVGSHLIVSVPREPLWRVLNVARGKYLRDWGNTPGHVQHWSRADLVRLVSCVFDVIQVRSPLPWTMLLCRLRGRR